MARTKLVARKNYNQRRANFQRRRPNAVKNREDRIRNRDIKMKKILKPLKNIQVRHWGRVVRNMVVRQKSIFPAGRRNCEY